MSKGMRLRVPLALAAAAAVAQSRPAAPALYRHGYYLFLSDPPIACEQCYVPLLLTVAPLEEVAKTPGGEDADMITTYERDSLFQMNGIVHVDSADVQAGPRTICVRKRNYRYQEITAAEVLRLFERPLGTMPISRPILRSTLPPGPPLESLIAGFRAVK